MKTRDVFLENYYYPELGNSTCTEAFNEAKINFEADKRIDCPFNGVDAMRRYIYRERIEKKCQ